MARVTRGAHDVSSLHAALSTYGLEHGGDTKALYRQPRAEQLAVLALKAGPWRDEEMESAQMSQVPAGMEIKGQGAAERAARIFGRG